MALFFLAAAAFAQTPPDARPRFEVASAKAATECGRGLDDPGPRGPGVSAPGKLELNCQTLEDLIQQAYVELANGVSFNRAELEIRGGPDWIRSDRYDISAKAAGGAHVAQMSGPMLQVLLEDRFQLKVHRETKRGDVYTLTVAKNGPKLSPTKEGNCTPIDLDDWPPTSGLPFETICGLFYSPPAAGGTMTFESDATTLPEFFASLADLIFQQPVIDKTGLTGRYDIRLEFSRDLGLDSGAGAGGGKKGGNGGNTAPRAESAGPSLPAAIESQLGLKLTPGKGPVEAIIVDRADRPSAN